MKRVMLLTGVTGRLGTDLCKRYGEEYAIAGVARKGDKPEGCSMMIHADITDNKWIVNSVLEYFGRLDVLVNNAATYHIKGIEDLTPEEMLRVLNVNVVAPYSLVRDCYMKFWRMRPEKNKKFKRRVINVGSVSGATAYDNQIAYGTSKAALDHLNIHLTKQLEECNVMSHIMYPNSFPRLVPTEKVTDYVIGLDRETATLKDHREIQNI